MGKRLGVLGAVIALVALAVGVVSPAFGSSGGEDDEQQTIRVVAVITDVAEIDVGAEGFSLGDQVVISGNLRQGGSKVGRLGVVCTFTSVELVEAHCPATATLPGGQITSQGLLYNRPQNFTLPVTGGSGTYQGAGGQLRARGLSETRVEMTFHLLLEN